MDIFDMESRLEESEQSVESLVEKKTQVQTREAELQKALSKLEQDIMISTFLDKKNREIEQEKVQVQGEIDAFKVQIDELEWELQALTEEAANSEAVIRELESLGEDVRDGLALLEERQALIQTCQTKLQEIIERLGLEAGSFGAELQYAAKGTIFGGRTKDWEAQLTQEEPRDRGHEFRERITVNTVGERIRGADLQELQDIAKNEELAQKVDFRSIDLEVARAFVHALWEIKQDYPNVYPDLGISFIGSTQAHNRAMEEKIQNTLIRLYEQYNPNVPKEVLAEKARKQTEQYMGFFAVGSGDYAVSIMVRPPIGKQKRPKQGEEFSESVSHYVGRKLAVQYNGIGINEEKARDYTELTRGLDQLERTGQNPQGCNSIKYLIDHEVAHQMDNLLSLSKDPMIRMEYLKFKAMSSGDQMSNLCSYAGENIHEFIAEAMAESRNRPIPGRIAYKIGAHIENKLKCYSGNKGGDDDDYVRERTL